MTTYLTLAFGLLILVKGADIMINAASKIARILKIPPFIIGLFIVALGTSAPEAAIGIMSGLKGANRMILGGVIGSNIVNIALVLGLTSMILPISIDSRMTRVELLLSMAVEAVLAVMMFTGNTLTRVESVILLAGMVGFVLYIAHITKRAVETVGPDVRLQSELVDFIQDQTSLVQSLDHPPKTEETAKTKAVPLSLPKQGLWFIAGLLGLVLGADLTVNSVALITQSLGWSEELIGLTVLAMGTSLPELTATLTAVLKQEAAIAVGNIIGSNIVNILLVLGISGLIHPIALAGPGIFFDVLVMVGASALLILPTLVYGRISKGMGFLFLSSYAVYLAVKLSGLL